MKKSNKEFPIVYTIINKFEFEKQLTNIENFLLKIAQNRQTKIL